MNDPTYTIRVRMTDVFQDGAFVPLRDVRARCEKHDTKVVVVEEKYFDLTTDDVRNFFFLGLNFPKQ